MFIDIITFIISRAQRDGCLRLSFTTACNTGFSTVFVLLANSAPKRLRGTVNGLAQTCVAATRITGPALFSNLFAWSMDHRCVDVPVGRGWLGGGAL